jgi:hypothetical protein
MSYMVKETKRRKHLTRGDIVLINGLYYVITEISNNRVVGSTNDDGLTRTLIDHKILSTTENDNEYVKTYKKVK